MKTPPTSAVAGASGALARPFPLTARHEWRSGPANDPLAGHDGLFQLGTDGCDTNWFLVVNGPARGTVWFIDDVVACPALDGRSGFAAWVAEWNVDPAPLR